MLLICSGIFFPACDNIFENPIDDLDLPQHEPLVAATALLSPLDSVPKIFISRTIGITEQLAYDALENAVVELYRDQTLYAEFYYDPASKFYLASQPFFEDHGSFRLEVEVPEFPAIYSEQIIPSPIIDLNTVLNINGGPLQHGQPTDELILSFSDDPNTDNYYELIVFPVFSYDSLKRGEQIYPESIDESLIKLDGGKFTFSDENRNGQQIGVSIYSNRFYSESLLELHVCLSSITKDKYLFLRTYQKYYENTGDLFSEPTIVHSNIENGEGIFTVESISIDTLRF